MVRNYKPQGNQTSPQTAGIQNLPKSYIERNTVEPEDNHMKKLMPIWNQATINGRKTHWTEEEMQECLDDYFSYCMEVDLKPNKAGLCLLLNCNKDTLWEWENKPSKYGAISEIIKKACTVIEMNYIERIDKYPTGNIFLLKTSHGHVEKSHVEIHNTSETSVNEINDLVAKMGLNKPK